MPITIGANIFSLRAQRAQSNATDALSKSFERLSSGLRVNRASDDAAGLAIADKLQVETRLYSTALRNIGDGVSALQIITSSLQSQLGITQRLQELAEQSANGTLSASQRGSLNKEYQSLMHELGRVGDTTSFNNLNLLLAGRSSSNPNTLNMQIGINGGVNSALTFSLNNSGSVSGKYYSSEDADLLAFAIGSVHSFSELESGDAGLVRQTVVDSNGVSRDVLQYFQAVSGGTTAVYFIRGDQSNGAISTSANDWICVGTANGTYDTSTGKPNAASSTLSFNITTFANGGSATSSLNISGLQIVAGDSMKNCSVLDFTGTETAVSARTALNILGRRQSELQDWIGGYGAIMSRLDSAHSVVSIARENTQAAQSRIRDVDVAQESSELVRSQILQQSASAILAQANSQPALALVLLKN